MSTSRDTDLVVRPLRGKSLYCLHRDWTYGRFTVREGFHTDGASIPRIFWTLIGGPARAAFMEAAVLHDWHYVRASWYDRTGRSLVHNIVDRKEADDIFYGLLKKNKVHPFRAWLMWLAVRSFGWLYWKKR